MNDPSLLLSEKKTLRKELKDQLKHLSSSRKDIAKSNAHRQFKDLNQLTLSFASRESEINLWPVNKDLALKKKLVLPLVREDLLELYLVKNPANLILSKWGIFEPNPKKCELVDPSQIKVALIPGLGFDLSFMRLGYGKGHYDRLIPQLTNAEKIGVGFKEQGLDHPIQCDRWDQPVDCVSLF